MDQSESLVELLKMAAHNEEEEHKDVYPAFAKIAEEEGFSEAAYAFSQIAKIERIHGERFAKLAQMLQQETYYEQEAGGEWMCLNCGYVVESTMAPASCPVCHHPQGYFVRMEMVPFH